jgi:integrase
MKPQNKSSKPSWPPILQHPRANGQVAYQIAVMLDGKRIRERFKTLEAAQERAEAIRNQYREEGKAAFIMPADLRNEATKCAKILEPHGATLTEAVNHYVKTVLAYRTAPSVAEIVNRLVAETEKNGRRNRTVRDLRERLQRFAKTYGSRQLSSLSVDEVRTWLDDPTLGARSKIHNATKISQLFNYAIRNGWADTNPVKNISRPSVEDTAPGIVNVEQAARLLEHADKYQLLPYVAIGLFAGLRSAELQRLDWSAVKLGERCIIIGAEVAKRRSRRVVEINDTLAAWLTLCAKPAGKVVPIYNLPRSVRTLAAAAGVKEWPHNALRHSFASYHLALHGDATKTAFQMGNSAVIVHNHYKGLVTNGDVSRFWNLRPAGADAGKIVPMQATA